MGKRENLCLLPKAAEAKSTASVVLTLRKISACAPVQDECITDRTGLTTKRASFHLVSW